MRYLRYFRTALVVAVVGLAGAAFGFRSGAAPERVGLRGDLDRGQPRLTELWRVALPVDVVGLPAADHAGVVVTAGQSQVVAISPTGRVEWTTAIDGVLARAPRLDGGMVFVAGERVVAALDRKSGALIWSAPTAPAGAANRANRPVVAAGVLVVTAANGLVLGLDPASGAERWRAVLPTASTAEPATGGAAGDPPAVVVVGIARWWGMDPATGSILWTRDIGLFGTSSPVVYANGTTSIAAVATNERLLAVEARTGHLQWQVAAEQSELFQVPVVAANGSELLVPDHWGRLTAFDPHNGRRLWEVDGPDTVAEFGEPVLVADRLVALPLDAEGPRLGTPSGSVGMKLPADGHGVADLPNRGLVVTTWGGATNYVLLYGVG